jgi:sec-independent protein translocase protein TatB
LPIGGAGSAAGPEADPFVAATTPAALLHSALMLNLSPEKLLLVGMIALIVLGPTRLPQAARTLGRLVAELRRMSSGFEREVRGALSEPTEAFKSAMGEFRPPDIGRSVRDTVNSTFRPPTPSVPPAGSPVPPPMIEPDNSATPVPPDDPSLN